MDILVEFEPGHVPGYIRLTGMELDLSAILGGRKIDINTPQCLSRYFRDKVVAEAEVHDLPQLIAELEKILPSL